jgi:hypothetical protein
MKKLESIAEHNQRIALAVQVLKATTCYSINQIEVNIDTDSKNIDMIEVYSIDDKTGVRSETFFHTSLCSIPETLCLGSYVCTDKAGICHLVIY